MGKRAGAFAGLLVLALGSGVVAQEPSTEPPPWFGGRVELPQHGYAFTLPEEWVAFDLGGDIDAQVHALESRLIGWPASMFPYTRDEWLPAQTAAGGQLAAVELTSYQDVLADPASCMFVGWTDAMPLEDLADALFTSVLANFEATEIEPPTPVALPVGAGWRFVHRWHEPDHPNNESVSVHYVVAGDVVSLAFNCTANARPEDDWLSIAETVEFLPAEE